MLLALVACKDKGEDTTTGDGGTTDSGAGDGGTTDGGTADGGTADGGTADGGTADGGTADGGTADGGSGDGGGDTGPAGFSLPENWGALLDGPSCTNGAFASLRNTTDTLGVEIDVTTQLAEACDAKDSHLTTTVSAKAFKLLQGVGINFEVCPQPSGSTGKATIENEFLMSEGTVTLDVAASPEWCADSTVTLMGQARVIFTDVIAGTGEDARAMGVTNFDPVYLNQAPPE